MKESKFTIVLKELDGFQLKRFEKFLASPYFNGKAGQLALFKHVVKYHPEFESDKLIKANILKDKNLKIHFPTKQAINKTLNELLKQFEQFIYFESEKHNYLGRQLAVSKFYGSKGLDRSFERSISVFPKTPKDVSPLISEEVHFGYLNQKYLLGILTSKMVRSNRLDGIQQAEDFLDAYYYLEKLRLNCEKESRRLLYGLSPKDLSKWSNLLFLPDPKLHEMPALDIFYQLNLMLSGAINEGIDAIIDKTRLKITSLSKEDTQSIIYLLLNYCVYQINNGHTEFNHQYLRINKILIEQNHLLEEGIIIPHRYKNIASVGSEVGEFEWTLDFIESFKPYLPAKNRELFYRISMAGLQLAMGQPDAAHQQLIFLGTKLQFENLTIRKLQMKIYYEKAEWDVLESHIKSFEQFLRRNKKLHESVKQSFKQLLYYTNKLMEINMGRGVDFLELQKDIQKEVKINDKAWLLNQLKKLKGHLVA